MASQTDECSPRNQLEGLEVQLGRVNTGISDLKGNVVEDSNENQGREEIIQEAAVVDDEAADVTETTDPPSEIGDSVVHGDTLTNSEVHAEATNSVEVTNPVSTVQADVSVGDLTESNHVMTEQKEEIDEREPENSVLKDEIFSNEAHRFDEDENKKAIRRNEVVDNPSCLDDVNSPTSITGENITESNNNTDEHKASNSIVENNQNKSIEERSCSNRPHEGELEEKQGSKTLENANSSKISRSAAFSPSKKTLKLHSLRTPGSPLGRSYNQLVRKMREKEEVEVVEEEGEEELLRTAGRGRTRGRGQVSRGSRGRQGVGPNMHGAVSDGNGYLGKEKMGRGSIGRGNGKGKGSSYGSVDVNYLQERGSEDRDSNPERECRSITGADMQNRRGGRKTRRWTRQKKQREDVDDEFAASIGDEEYFEKEFVGEGSVDEDPGTFEKQGGKRNKRKQKKKKKRPPQEQFQENDFEDDFGYSSRFIYYDANEDNYNQGQFNKEGQRNYPNEGHGGYHTQAPYQRGVRHGPREFRRSRPPRTEEQISDETYMFDERRSGSSVSESSSISGTAHCEDYGRIGQHLAGLTITACEDGRRRVQTSEGAPVGEEKPGRRRNKNRRNRKTSGQEQEQHLDPPRNAQTHSHDLELDYVVEDDVDCTNDMPSRGRSADGPGKQHRQRERHNIEEARKGDYSSLLEKSNKKVQYQNSEPRYNPDSSEQVLNKKRKQKKSKNKFKRDHDVHSDSQDQRFENNAGMWHGVESLDEFSTDPMSRHPERTVGNNVQDDRKLRQGMPGQVGRGGIGGRGERERTMGRVDEGAAGDAYRGGQRGRGRHHNQRSHRGLDENSNVQQRGGPGRGGGGQHRGNDRLNSPQSLANERSYSPCGQTDQRPGGNQGGSGYRGGHRGQQQRDGQQRRNQHRRAQQQKQKEKYESYWSTEAVSEGLKRGTLIEGPIRINPKSYTDAYVPLPDGTSDIYIPGLLSRNRALNADVVAVQLLDRQDWRVYTDELEQCEAQARSEEKLATGGVGDSDSGPDVVIEEEKEELAKQGSPPAKKEERKKATTPRKSYTSMREVLSVGSPVAKSLFEPPQLGAAGDHENIEHRAQADSLLQKTGKVVAILEKKHSRAASGHIRLMNDKNPHVALFSPTDSRVPRIQVPMKECPADFLERPEDHAKTLYIARITSWGENSVFANGQLARSLGEAGEIEPETEAILIEHNVEVDEFPQEVLNCLPQELPWKIPAEEFVYRRDLRSQCIFTIDPATARDLDDAMSIELLDSGKYQVGVHIADVSFFIEESSHLDVKAASRATSVYLVQKVIPMLPRLLCEELCSLNPDADRLAFSVIWTMDQNGNVEEEWFGRTVIRSCVKLSYQHAQGFIEQPEREWTQEELPPISGSFSVDDIKQRVLQLDKIAKCLRKRRFDGGALRLDQVKLTFTLNQETGMPNGYLVYEQKDSNRLIEEFMLLANMAVAHRIHKHFPEKAVLRRHPPPQNKMVDDLKDLCEQLGVSLNLSNSQTWQESLSSYQGADDFSAARMQVLVALSSKPMQNAKYFCSGMIEDTDVYRHYALNVPLYTHFTSPIRRYADVMVHRLLAASLEYTDETEKDCKQLHKQADHCNDKKYMAKRVQDMSSELFFAAFVREAGPFEEKGMVMGVMDHSFDVFILKFAVVKRIYCDQLDLKSKVYVRDHKKPELTLVWRGNETQEEVTQTIDIFTSVSVHMLGDKDPLKWKALLKRPSTNTARVET